MATVTGTLQNTLGTTGPGQVTVQLCGYGGSIPRANGVALYSSVSTEPADIPVTAAGTFTFEVDGNDTISPAGTYYTVTIADMNGDAVQVNAYRFIGTGSFDLNLIEPYDPNQPPPPLPPLITDLLLVVPWSATPEFPGDTYTSFRITLDGNVTSTTAPGAVSGNLYTFIIFQDAVGGHAWVWPNNCINGSAINLNPNGLTVQTFVMGLNNLVAIGPATWWD
jgi:hypothetical protein